MQKIDFFIKEKMVLSAVLFIKLKCRWLLTGLLDLKEHLTIEMLLMLDFYAFFKLLHFFNYSRFSKFISSSC